jgi:hypothetical protein
VGTAQVRIALRRPEVAPLRMPASAIKPLTSANIPADHPKTVYLNEDKLNAALFAYLRTAIFGPERLDYWTRCLNDAAGPERTAPAAERMKAAQAELADLERRLDRQLLNLEADDTTQLCDAGSASESLN